jgi:enterochelin esterase-like enzyme
LRRAGRFSVAGVKKQPEEYACCVYCAAAGGQAIKLISGISAALLASSASVQVLDVIPQGGVCRSDIGCQITVDPSDPEIASAQCEASSPLAISQSGDRLRVTLQADERPLNLSGTLYTDALTQIGENCWVAEWRLPHLAQSKFVFYGFTAQGRRIGQAEFRGEAAGMDVAHVDLASEIETVTLFDAVSDIERDVHLYEPPQLGDAAAPVLILPDGQSITRTAQIVQALIDQGRIAPILIVALEARMDAPFARSDEYVPGAETDMHARHMAFFEQDFISWITERYQARVTDEGWLIFGASASATFALSTTQAQTPIDHIIAPSPALSDLNFLEGAKASGRTFHIAAGLYETEFQPTAIRYAEQLRLEGGQVETPCYASGHDYFTWDAALRNALIATLGAPTRDLPYDPPHSCGF